MDRDIYEKAKEKVKKKKKFHKSLSNFLITGTILFFINVFIARGYMWSLWVIFFWGLAILKEAIDVYGFPFGSSNWEEQEIEKEMKRMKELGEGNTKSEFPEPEKDYPPIQEERNRDETRSGKGWNEKDLV